MAKFPIMGPKNMETKKRTRRTAAFHRIGPNATIAIRINGDALVWVFFSTKDLTKMYAMTNNAALQIGKMISDPKTVLHDARGTSPDSFSEGCPSLFLLNPVMFVLDNLQYPIQELAWDRELPRDIQRRNSR